MRTLSLTLKGFLGASLSYESLLPDRLTQNDYVSHFSLIQQSVNEVDRPIPTSRKVALKIISVANYSFQILSSSYQVLLASAYLSRSLKLFSITPLPLGLCNGIPLFIAYNGAFLVIHLLFSKEKQESLTPFLEAVPLFLACVSALMQVFCSFQLSENLSFLAGVAASYILPYIISTHLSFLDPEKVSLFQWIESLVRLVAFALGNIFFLIEQPKNSLVHKAATIYRRLRLLQTQLQSFSYYYLLENQMEGYFKDSFKEVCSQALNFLKYYNLPLLNPLEPFKENFNGYTSLEKLLYQEDYSQMQKQFYFISISWQDLTKSLNGQRLNLSNFSSFVEKLPNTWENPLSLELAYFLGKVELIQEVKARSSPSQFAKNSFLLQKKHPLQPFVVDIASLQMIPKSQSYSLILQKDVSKEDLESVGNDLFPLAEKIFDSIMSHPQLEERQKRIRLKLRDETDQDPLDWVEATLFKEEFEKKLQEVFSKFSRFILNNEPSRYLPSCEEKRKKAYLSMFAKLRLVTDFLLKQDNFLTTELLVFRLFKGWNYCPSRWKSDIDFCYRRINTLEDTKEASEDAIARKIQNHLFKVRKNIVAQIQIPEDSSPTHTETKIQHLLSPYLGVIEKAEEYSDALGFNIPLENLFSCFFENYTWKNLIDETRFALKGVEKEELVTWFYTCLVTQDSSKNLYKNLEKLYQKEIRKLRFKGPFTMESLSWEHYVQELEEEETVSRELSLQQRISSLIFLSNDPSKEKNSSFPLNDKAIAFMLFQLGIFTYHPLVPEAC